MQKNLYFIIILFCLSSCYTYQVKKQADPATANNEELKKGGAPTNMSSAQMKTAESLNPNAQQAPAPINIQERLTPNKNVKINVDGKTYKVIVDKWESDSLVVHPVHQPKKILKFHKNQINAEKIGEKRFSQPIADIITVTVYAGIAVGIWSLLR